MKKERAAVVGGGFGGLALAWHLLDKGLDVILYDEKAIGNSASGAASGLLHPYPGESAKRSVRASEALLEAKKLLDESAKHSSQAVMGSPGMERIVTEVQAALFHQHAATYGDVRILSPDRVWISSGIPVYAKAYLEGLYRACVAKGLVFEQKKVSSFEELSSYQYRFFAPGPGVFSMPGGGALRVRPVRGQALVCESPSSPLAHPLLGKGYLVPLPEGGVILGSTYERGSLSEDPCLEVALRDLEPKARVLLPSWDRIQVKECKAGVRVASEQHYFPLLKEMAERTYLLTALGSRGLLYHAHAARLLVQAALSKNTVLPYDRLL